MFIEEEEPKLPLPKRKFPVRLRPCCVCGKRKPVSEFYKHPSNADGLNRACRECCCKRQKKINAKQLLPSGG